MTLGNSRLITVFVCFGILWLLIVGKTFHIQIIKSSYFAQKSDSQSTQRLVIVPERGTIYDRNGAVLSYNSSAPKTEGAIPRFLPYGKLASQTIGHVGRDGKGMVGIERSFDNHLRGIDGWRNKKVDVNRRIYEGMELDGSAPVPGLDVILTIDKDIQQIAETALERGVKNVNADRGAVVVVDPHTGDILAMASYPDYNPNELSKLDMSTTQNDVIGMVYEPGSTFKLIAASAAIEEKVMTPQDSIDGNMGVYKIYGDVIRDTHKYGMMSFADAVAYSSNVAFAQISSKIGKESYFRYVRKFGFGTKTGIELPGEEKGWLKNISSWSGRTLVTMAMGHEIMATPLQIAMAYSVVANNGLLLKPRIIKELRNKATGETVVYSDVKVIRQVMSEQSAAIVRDLLAGVVEYGTADNLKSEIVQVAGKTGTAEKYSVAEKRYIRSSMNSSFCGMAPVTHPKYVCMVVIDEPRTYTSGAKTAGPVFKEIMEKIQVSPRVNTTGIRKDFAHSALENSGAKGRDSLYAERTVMPDLKGKSLREVVDIMSGRGITVEYSGSGWVGEQVPVIGESLENVSICKVTLVENI